MELKTCITPNCDNPRDRNRRICTACRNHKNGEAAKRRRQAEAARRKRQAGKVKVYGPCNPDCAGWRQCTRERLWVDGPLPCETLLKFEVDYEYEKDSQPTIWVMPLTAVRLNIEAA